MTDSASRDDAFAGIPTGDMPGDSVRIGPAHVAKARTIYPRLRALLAPRLDAGERAVVSVYGGSGVGKSEIGSVLAEMLRRDGVGTYVLSGDNYPHRIPAENDAERARVHQEGGRPALARYLGSDAEIDFGAVNGIIREFHANADRIRLKRMGRQPGDVRWGAVDVRDTRVLVIEWTHGNNPRLCGVDVPVFLNSTPEETLAHRRARARDGATDSPFTMMVLELEQALLAAQAPRAAIIVAKDGTLLAHEEYQRLMAARPGTALDASPMLNLYPDSVGGHLSDVVNLLARPEVEGAFGSVYLLPSVFNTDLDRGFSVIDYDLAEAYATREDVQALRALGLDLKLDFILNHASVLSPQFQDLLARGTDSEYADFFIDWNEFWAGKGTMTEAGYVRPDPELVRDMFLRKPGLPVLAVRMPDGTDRWYWNTFYQEVRYPVLDAQDLMPLGMQYGVAVQMAAAINAAVAAGERPGAADLSAFPRWAEAAAGLAESRRRYLGQMDLDVRSPKVWEFYAETLATLAGYGARIVRLDAFAYAPKAPGRRNFLNEPETWELLARVGQLADRDGLTLLPEIHATYAEKVHETIAAQGYLVYDFFLPGLLIHAFETRDATTLKRWIAEQTERGIRCVNMLGCHDGIPVLDLKGLLTEGQIRDVIRVITDRGGIVKDLHGARDVYYQVNATYYSALGASDAALLLARAIQIFMPGKPQVWYLDLFGGENDLAAVPRGHKEINRTNLTRAEVDAGLTRQLVRDQIALLRFRRDCPAFGFDAVCTVAPTAPGRLDVTWERAGRTARLVADLATRAFEVSCDGEVVHSARG